MNAKLREAAIEIVNELILGYQPNVAQNVAAAELKWRSSPEGRAAAQKRQKMISELTKSAQDARKAGNNVESRKIEQELRDLQRQDLHAFSESQARTVNAAQQRKSQQAAKLTGLLQRIKGASNNRVVVLLLQEAFRV